MKVLLLNTRDSSGGAARAATRLLAGLKQRGVDARMLVKEKSSLDPDVVEPKTFDKILGLIRPRLEGRLVRRYPHWNGLSFTPALLPDRLLCQVDALAPDLIHLNWMGDGFLRLETLARFNRPVVWTLHDSWPFTGGCHIPLECLRYRQSCGSCPALGSDRENDLSRSVWQRKSSAWQDLDLTVVAPSNWIAECARASSLMRDRRIEVVPNGIDLQTYRPLDKVSARDFLGLPQDRKLVLFGGYSATADRNKGFHLFTAALAGLPPSVREGLDLILFGSQATESAGLIEGLKTHQIGWLHDDLSLAVMYSAADAFVFPSIQESLGYTAMEAMACGTPCVAFRQGGVPDLVDHEVNGYLARPFEASDLAQGISWVLENAERRRGLSVKARAKIEHGFSLESVAARYSALFTQLLQHRAA